jgi:hypothetical protein
VRITPNRQGLSAAKAFGKVSPPIQGLDRASGSITPKRDAPAAELPPEIAAMSEPRLLL